MEAAQPYLAYFTDNPSWAITFVFLIAFGEALLIIGLFVPSTVALVGAGMLVGMGKLDFWQVFWATAIGAIAGDQLSYWVGRFYGDQLKTMWPLRNYASLMDKGESFVREHGGKSIAVGRFIPGIKAVVPGVVGMLGMNQPFFIFVNVTSGLVWTAFHVFPGILLGQGLAIAGDLSGRLAEVLVILVVGVGIVAWLVRLGVASVMPRVKQGLLAMSQRALNSKSRMAYRLGRAINPANPRFSNTMLYGMSLFVGLLGFAYLLVSFASHQTVSNFDRSIATLFGELRNAHMDDLMLPISMFDNLKVLSVALLGLLVWLAFHKAWRAIILVGITWIGSLFVSLALRGVFARPGPSTFQEFGTSMLASFPSIHVTMTVVFFGMLVAFAVHAMGRWSKAAAAAIAAIWVLIIAYSRIYLGVSWLSDVLAGLALGGITVAAFGLVLEANPSRRIRPVGLIAVAGLFYLSAGVANTMIYGEAQAQAFTQLSTASKVNQAEWLSAKWKELPARRIDLAGKPEEEFIAQWQGKPDVLKPGLIMQKWVVHETWRWRDAFGYLDHSVGLAKLAPKPLLNEGLKARLTASKMADDGSGERIVLRLYQSRLEIADKSDGTNVYLVSVTRESAPALLGRYAFPQTVAAKLEDREAGLALLATQSGLKPPIEEKVGSGKISIFTN
jgi:membrane protein DedA with SNARE-associated domain/membrane-associated phospholipid phosphatase